VNSLPTTIRTRLFAAPVPLRAALGLLVIQSIGFIAFGAYEFTQVQPGRVMTGVITGVLLILWGLGLAAGGYAMLAGRMAARGPVAAAEIIQVPTAWSFLGGQTTWVAILMGITSLAILVLVVLPQSTRHFTGSREQRG